jgi:hypothetical protein
MHSLRGPGEPLIVKYRIERRQTERDEHRQHNQHDE